MVYNPGMDQFAAQQHAELLNQEHPEKDRYRWFAREANESRWEVIRVAAPGRPGITGTMQKPAVVEPSTIPHGQLPGGLPNWSA